ncbi:hypothetical protein DZF91_15190 [Actinomadura logoneensis]|uniref:Uncharacterized protein n=1 Tax=Actinomadura logoneensis TaxID=2293572 RepID=A0A372JLC0_9ACTN|nr:hypothetical protein [Actinomadura logoneensis]RFU40817.1 hypothetical protein DZF91_15190 [Actinomadura logoneensis]
MRAVLNGWLLAVLVAAIALLARAALAPAEGTGPVDEYARVARVHLPWILGSMVMTYVAASATRPRHGVLVVVAVALPMPTLAMLAGTAVPVIPGQSTLGTVLQLIEALLGGAVGIVLASVIGNAARQAAKRPEQVWDGGGGLRDPHGILTPQHLLERPEHDLPSSEAAHQRSAQAEGRFDEREQAMRQPSSVQTQHAHTQQPPVQVQGQTQTQTQASATALAQAAQAAGASRGNAYSFPPVPTLPPTPNPFVRVASSPPDTPFAPTRPSVPDTPSAPMPVPGAPLTAGDRPSAFLPEDRLVASGRRPAATDGDDSDDEPAADMERSDASDKAGTEAGTSDTDAETVRGPDSPSAPPRRPPHSFGTPAP